MIDDIIIWKCKSCKIENKDSKGLQELSEKYEKIRKENMDLKERMKILEDKFFCMKDELLIDIKKELGDMKMLKETMNEINKKLDNGSKSSIMNERELKKELTEEILEELKEP